MDEDAKVTVLSGTSPHGQGHQTAWAQLAAEALQIPMEDVTVKHGDTDVVPRGIGTFGSRSAPVGGSAVIINAETVRDKGREIAAHLLEAPVAEARPISRSIGVPSRRPRTRATCPIRLTAS